MDTPITYDDVIIEESLDAFVDPSWKKEALIYIERFKAVYLGQRQQLIAVCVDEWNRERDRFLVL